MEYLFFDIECSDGIHICTFGYALFDANFNLIEREDIIINPETPIMTSLMKKRAGFTLAYPTKTFKKSPVFPYYYERIKEILTAPNRINIGHAAYNDARFIKTACLRYELPVFDFEFKDTQQLFKHFIAEVEVEGLTPSTDIGLDRLCEILQVEIVDLHRSDADAFMTQSVFRKMCSRFDVSVEELLQKPNGGGGIRGGEVELDKPKRMLSDEKLTTNDMTNKNRKLLKRVLERVTGDEGYEKTLENRKVAISFGYENRNFTSLLKIVKEIYNRGGEYINDGTEADIFLYRKKGGNPQCMRQKQALERSKKGYAVEFMTVDEFLPLLGIRDGEQLESMALPVIDLNGKTVRSLTKKTSEVRYKDKHAGFTVGGAVKKRRS